MLRRLPGNWEKHCNNISRLLGKQYEQWATVTERTLVRAMNRGANAQELTAILQHAVDDLRGPLAGVLRQGIMKSATLATGGPLAGYEYSPRALKALAERIAKSDAYVDNTLLPSIVETVTKHIGVPNLDRLTIRAALDVPFAKVTTTAGHVWASIGETQKAALQGYQEDGKQVVPVRWELDPQAVHCQTSIKYGTFGCVTLAGTYMGGIDTLPTLPGANTTCGINDRCHLSLSFDGGKTFKRYSS